jgi:hypothetical protein
VDTFLRDARNSLRVLLKEPGFTFLAILTLTFPPRQPTGSDGCLAAAVTQLWAAS